MSVYQVEEYYISLDFEKLSDETVAEVAEALDYNNYSDYEFQYNNTTLVVNGIESEQDGENLEEIIKGIIE